MWPGWSEYSLQRGLDLDNRRLVSEPLEARIRIVVYSQFDGSPVYVYGVPRQSKVSLDYNSKV